jgi:hypothetical protein
VPDGRHSAKSRRGKSRNSHPVAAEPINFAFAL